MPARSLTTRVEGFVGPLCSLLEMVRSSRGKATDFPAARLARWFRSYVESRPTRDPDAVGEFADIASRLWLLKSQHLLPLTERPSDTEDPPAPLHLEGRPAPCSGILEVLMGRASAGLESFARGQFVAPAPKLVQPAPMSPRMLVEAYEEQMQELLRRRLTRVPSPVFLRLEVASRMLRRSLVHAQPLSFSRLLRERGMDRRGAVVYFLAVLDLARERVVEVRQRLPFDDIVLVPGEGRRLKDTTHKLPASRLLDDGEAV